MLTSSGKKLCSTLSIRYDRYVVFCAYLNSIRLPTRWSSASVKKDSRSPALSFTPSMCPLPATLTFCQFSFKASRESRRQQVYGCSTPDACLMRVLSIRWRRRFVRWLGQRVRETADKNLLLIDAGCGDGFYTCAICRVLARRAAKCRAASTRYRYLQMGCQQRLLSGTKQLGWAVASQQAAARTPGRRQFDH